MKKMIHVCCVVAAAILSATVRAEEVRIVRDNWGVPHIFAPTDEGASFGLGYAQAEDRLEELLKNYLRADGSISTVLGMEGMRDDVIMRMWRHQEISKKNYDQISPKVRACIEAFQEGVKTFMQEHPEQVPAWAPAIEPWQVVALSRFIVWGWPLGDAAEDLERAKIPFDKIPYHGSNQWIIGGKRTESGAPIALIDPHLSWYDYFRFYECRVYGETIKVSGMSIVGSSLPSLGHSQWCSIAMTTGSGDTADIFEETVNPANKLQYNVDGEWRDMTVRREVFGVLQKDGTVKNMEIPITFTHHGPIVAHRGDKVYAMAIPYEQSVGLADQIYEMMTAKNLGEMKKALSRLELMGQNVMVATVDGDIYYQRTGKVPVRPAGVNSYLPIPATTSAHDWQGIHKPEELVQIENPDAGYMQNCNNAPYFMMKSGAPRLADYPSYVYGADEHLDHQRNNVVLDQLDAKDKWSVEEAKELAMTLKVRGASHWQARLLLALTQKIGALQGKPDAGRFGEMILKWDGNATAESKGALAYVYWKREIQKSMKPWEISGGEERGEAPPERLAPEVFIDALVSGAAEMIKERGSLDTAYGDVYRVGRRGGDRTWPVGGGSVGAGLDTARAISFDKKEDGTFLGRGGQTSTQVVELTRPPRSWTVVPLGQSDHKESGHWDDQAEKLFSKGLMKPTYFMNDAELKANMESEKTLVYARK